MIAHHPPIVPLIDRMPSVGCKVAPSIDGTAIVNPVVTSHHKRLAAQEHLRSSDAARRLVLDWLKVVKASTALLSGPLAGPDEFVLQAW